MTASFPQKVSISLTLELQIPDSEAASYVFASPDTGSTELQLGLIADLFDILSYHSDLQVLSINNLSLAEIQKKLASTGL
jgi:hypothetical protein